MKILFLCGSVEPGKDGVGDYVRRLAEALGKAAHQAAVIAFNDPYVKEISDDVENANGQSLRVVRIPAAWSQRQRHQFLQECINDIDPEWLSLQFVPYAYHPKGLPFFLGRTLKALGGNHKWHLMFHELWVGMDSTATTKDVALGWVQRRLIQSLVENLRPAVIHTQTQLYLHQLQRLGVNAKHLPLFGNIPLVKADIRKPEEQNNRTDKLSLVLFGGIHPGAPVEGFVKEAADYGKQHGLTVELTFIGRNGNGISQWVDACKTFGLGFTLLGEQPAENVSQVFLSSSFGISTTPLALAEKSGSIAAMHEHGLTVVCVRHPWRARGVEQEPSLNGMLQYLPGNFAACLKSKPPLNVGAGAAGIAEQLAASLVAANKKTAFSAAVL